MRNFILDDHLIIKFITCVRYFIQNVGTFWHSRVKILFDMIKLNTNLNARYNMWQIYENILLLVVVYPWSLSEHTGRLVLHSHKYIFFCGSAHGCKHLLVRIRPSHHQLEYLRTEGENGVGRWGRLVSKRLSQLCLKELLRLEYERGQFYVNVNLISLLLLICNLYF